MGVTGLWRLIEPAGKPVPVETLENKVLAVDISIWLHQMVKGYQDAKGAPMPNAHLLGLFQRLCKLLYFRVKPVFVFDGGFPDLKKETIAKRQDNKAKLNSESERLRREILLLLGKKTAIGSLLGKTTSPKKNKEASGDKDDIFKLPDLPKEEISDSSSEEEVSTSSTVDLHSIDLESENFKKMPLKEKHDVLIELKETRKMNSWGRLNELPKDSDHFSDFQMKRLLKRRKVQECLEETEREIGGHSMTINELELLLNEEGIKTDMDGLPTKRIASDDKTRYLLISNIKQALEEAKKMEVDKMKSIPSISKVKSEDEKETLNDTIEGSQTDSMNDEDLQKAIQMSLECIDNDDEVKDQSIPTDKSDSLNSTFMIDSEYSDSNDDGVNFQFDAAKAFMVQNTDFTAEAINQIVSKKTSVKHSKPKNKIDKLLAEIDKDLVTTLKKYKNKSQPEHIAPLELSSSDEDGEYKLKSTSKTSDIEDMLTKATHTVTLNSIEKHSTLRDVTQSEESSDCSDFEDVPEVKSTDMTKKTVVALNLQAMNETPESDIFADVFEEKSKCYNKTPSTKQSKVNHSSKQELAHELNIQSCGNNECLRENNSTLRGKYSEELETTLNKTSENTPANVHNVENSPEFQKVSLESINEHSTEIKKKEVLASISPQPSVANNDFSTEKPQTTVEQPQLSVPKNVLSTEQLQTMAEQLDNEQENLMHEKSKFERMGRNITEQMTKDAQELLQLFGIPYIVAPCEAEAQCAFLELANLTDGTITDDSDIWLFGGKTVYKNFFNQNKLVMQFLADRIHHSFNLSREQLILLALLVGSDYTTGLHGVGPVTALEILASFTSSRKDILLFQAATNAQTKYTALLSGLIEFKKWLKAGKTKGDNNLRKKLRNVKVSDDFPNLRVVQAYMEPEIETSKEKFTWGEPDLTTITDYARNKFGWSKNKLDEILNPVLKRIQDKKQQKTMQDYFRRKIEFHSLEDQMSKRVKAAIDKMGSTEKEVTTEKKIKKRVVKKKKPPNSIPESIVSRIENFNEPSTSNITKVVTVPEVVSSFDITVPKLDRYQEIIPQREKDKMDLLKTKLKAIEVYRKSRLDHKTLKKRKPNLPKDTADLSESDSE